MTLIWKLLRKHISIFELVVFFIANLIGMVVILAGVQLYSDFKPLVSGDDSLIGNDYVVISKHIDRAGYVSSTIDNDVVAELKRAPFTHSVGVVASSSFDVEASVEFGGNDSMGMSTLMFFEAVPDNFIDVNTDKWQYDSKTKSIPIIIPRNYLNLYNFGFSASQNLPKITEKLLMGVNINIELAGNGRYDEYVGKIVGFSDRINTILVPWDFLAWANKHYASVDINDTTISPSRVIAEIENPADQQFIEFLKRNSLETEDRSSSSDQAQTILNICLYVIVAIGLLFCALSLIILTLSIHLLLQKNIDKLQNLTLIGYTPTKVAMPYYLMTVALNVTIMVISIFAVVVIQRLMIAQLPDDIASGISLGIIPTIITGIIVTAANVAFNIFIIRRKVVDISKKR